MTPLRRRMDDDMKLHGLAANTRKTYLSCIATIARFFGRSPATFTDEDLRVFFLQLSTLSRCRKTISVYLCALKFLYRYTLKAEMPVFEVIRPPKRTKLPVIFSRREVHDILEHITHAVYRTICMVLYSCGLRVNEALHLTVADIDSSRMMLCVRNGKGGRDRYVPMPERLLVLLREHYRAHRPVRPWIFANPATGKPYTYRSVERAFGLARMAAAVTKDASCHGLRHAYATHLFEADVPLIVIQQLLGHANVSTTAVYAHVTPVLERKAAVAAQGLISDWEF